MAYNNEEPGGVMNEIQMTVAEIMSHLHDILPDQEILKAHLLNPTGNWVQSIYFKMLLEFGFSDKMLDVHGYTNNSIADHAEIFQQTVPVYKLLAACKYFLSCVNHQEKTPFGLFDLTEPDPKRTKRFLASMVNFWQFSNIHYEKVERVRSRVLSAVEEKGRLQSDIRNLGEMIEKIRMSNAEDGIKERNVNGQIAEMETEMEKWAAEMEEVEQGLEEIKLALVEAKADEEKLESVVTELSRKEENLKLVLKSVDLNKEMEMQLEQLKDERDSKLSSEKGELDKQIYGLEEKIKEMKSLMENMENFGKLGKQVKSKTSERRAKERQIELIKADVDNMESRILMWKKKNGELALQKAALLSKGKKRNESKEADLKGYRAEFQELKKGLSEEEVVAGELKSRVNNAKRELQRLSQESEQQTLAFEQEYARLLATTKQRFDEIMGDVEMIQNACNEL